MSTVLSNLSFYKNNLLKLLPEKCLNQKDFLCCIIKNKEGKFVINPPDETQVTEGCKVIVFGTRAQIAEMKDNLDD